MAWNGEPTRIKEVERSDDTWMITTTDSSGFGFSTKYTEGKPDPQPGDLIQTDLYRGSMIRGITLRGERLYYLSDEQIAQQDEERTARHRAEQLEKFEQEREALDADYEALPDVFRRRIDWFRAHNPDFRWKFEAYEMSVCKDAVRIAATLETPKKIAQFGKASYEKQRELVPGLYDGHSGNSFACAVQLASWYVQNPLWVIAEHGALTPLVGCDEYGCAHPRPQDVLDAIKES